MTLTPDIRTAGREPLMMLNVGCGDTSHPDWTNLDLRGSRSVECRDVTQGLPFPDESFDVVYHSHLLEHLLPEKALPFMRECHRVLKPGGTLRILVPDLEQIARLYLEKLGQTPDAADDYDWMMLELYDQCVRVDSGGRMEEFLRRPGTRHSAFVAQRMGGEAAAYWEEIPPGRLTADPKAALRRWLWKVRTLLAAWGVFLIAGSQGRSAFEAGLFRASGEIHQWMYDRFSLERLMTDAGFMDPSVTTAFESRIPGFARYGLDVVDGVVRKPDSLVMEGGKP
ncbi:SAM-dependent methyltransferase, putative [Citrifermentans bemidjiense Bem]|uniref:SAM-dependent methyltransferase, putative n=1 Tax=Citrifermentans bemidjiense (strain ATCC BAA-1014 / DSM 16622 / JCM 12645 / Bem) TaxID=404380 RepID=B5EGU1_CITBB|nr:methyltransferase domain-containing protein [Citrifermentans bemidjiense]ACH39574.1 SAM-dependent methyltransferase, putative [Citrifermentans bemidjiense Bem]